MNILNILVVGRSPLAEQIKEAILEAGHVIEGNVDFSDLIIYSDCNVNKYCFEFNKDKPQLSSYVLEGLNESLVGWGVLNESKCLDVSTLNHANESMIERVLLDDFHDILITYSRQKTISYVDTLSEVNQCILDKSYGINDILAAIREVFSRYRSDSNVDIFIADIAIPNGIIPSRLTGSAANKIDTDNCLTIAYSEQSNEDFPTYIKPSAILSVREHFDKFTLNLNYSTLPFKWFFEHLNAILSNGLNKDTNLSSIPIVCKDEVAILNQWGRRVGEYDFEKSIVEVFNDIVSEMPEKIAVIYRDKKWTYQELDAEINKVGAAILSISNTQQRIAVAVDRGIGLVASLLGVLKTGNAYVPLDSAYPKERIEFILADTRPNSIICDDIMKEKLSWLEDYAAQHAINLINYDHIRGPAQSVTFPSVKPQDVAYIIYTSGTTGKPKGVIIKHLSIVNLAKSYAINANIIHDSVLLSVASIGFDAIGWDIYGALLNGATLAVADDESRLDLQKLAGYINTNKITIATLTPAIVKHLPMIEYPSLAILIIMGDTGDIEMFDYWSEKCRVFNGYGPTEATVAATLNEYTKGENVNSIGVPLHHYGIYIVDQNLNLLPPGVTGELCISGPCVASGYLNLENETQKKFVSCDFIDAPYHQRLYKTGDYASWQANGRIQFKGRRDQQVKILGIRIEITELEQALVEYTTISQAAVILIKKDDNKHLIAFYTNKDGVLSDKDSIVDYMKSNFHASVVPKHFILLETMPLTVNAKVDKKLLEQYPINIDVEYVAPRSAREEFICQLFSDVLGCNKIGIYDNFFQLGGHSLSAAQITSRINEYFKTSMKISAIFNYQTPAALSEQITSKSEASWRQDQIRVDTSRVGPISYAQQRLWYLYQYDSSNCAYNLPIVLRFSGDLNLTAFNSTLEYLIRRHESLRTIIVNNNGEAVQKVIENFQFNHLLPVQIKESDLDSAITGLIKTPFDIENEVCWRHALFKLDNLDHVLVTVKHNLITDAWSEGVLIREFNEIYKATINNQPSALAEIFYQPLDYAINERSHVTRASLIDDIGYWKAKLSNYIDTEIPADYPRKLASSDEGLRCNYVFKGIQVDEIHALAAKLNATPFMIYLTVLNVLIYRYTGQLDLTIGTATSGRSSSLTEKMTSFFVNTIPIRSQFTSNMSISDAVNQVRHACIEAYDHQELPFDWLVDEVNARRELNKSPIFQIMMVLQNANEGFSLDLPDVSCEPIQVQTHTTMFDLLFNFVENMNSLELNIDYSIHLYHGKTIATLIEHFESLLIEFVKDEKSTISDLAVYSEKQLHEMLSICCGKVQQIPSNTIFEIYSNIKNKFPDKIALETEDEQLTFSQLFDRSLRLAEYISVRNVHRHINPVVAIILNRNSNLITTLLASIFSGCTYIPIDPEYPVDRIKYMIEDSGAACVLTESALESEIKELELQIPAFFVNTVVDSFESKNAAPDFQENENIYTIYTSGSTGQPKGVTVRKASVLNTIQSFVEMLNCSSNDVLVSITTVSFDIFALEYLMPILTGAKLILCGRSVSRDPVKLVNYLNLIKPTLIQATPTIWGMIADHLLPNNGKLKIISGGESLPNSVFDKLSHVAREVWNVYGPTETTIWSTAIDVKKSKLISIGKPISNTQCYILDERLQFVPRGGIGELYIGGAGLAGGYWQRPLLTNEKFIKIHVQESELMVYATGDLVRLNRNNDFEYLGRKDLQVKIRGNRIELSEIETVVSQYSGIKSAVVAVFGDGDNKLLVVYYVVEENIKVDKSDLHHYLTEKLPTVMIPSAYMQLDSFPMTHNKKIDRKSLPVPESEFSAQLGKFVEPSNEKEYVIQQIWSEVLKIKKISVIENFFMIGGNSLHIPMIVTKLNTLFSSKLTLRDFILNSTIQGNAALLVDFNITQKIMES